MSQEYLSAEEILETDDIPFEDVVVPEWKGKRLRVVGMNAEDASKFSSKLVQVGDDGKVKAVNIENFLPQLLSMSLYNDAGEKIFKTEEQVKAFGKKSAAVLKRLGDIASRLSGLNEEAVKDAAKN